MYKWPAWIFAIAFAVAVARYVVKPCCEVSDDTTVTTTPPDTVMIIPGDTVMLIPGDSIRIRGPHAGVRLMPANGLLLKRL